MDTQKMWKTPQTCPGNPSPMQQEITEVNEHGEFVLTTAARQDMREAVALTAQALELIADCETRRKSGRPWGALGITDLHREITDWQPITRITPIKSGLLTMLSEELNLLSVKTTSTIYPPDEMLAMRLLLRGEADEIVNLEAVSFWEQHGLLVVCGKTYSANGPLNDALSIVGEGKKWYVYWSRSAIWVFDQAIDLAIMGNNSDSLSWVFCTTWRNTRIAWLYILWSEKARRDINFNEKNTAQQLHHIFNKTAYFDITTWSMVENQASCLIPGACQKVPLAFAEWLLEPTYWGRLQEQAQLFQFSLTGVASKMDPPAPPMQRGWRLTE